MARSLADIVQDDANHDVVCSVLDKLQDDIHATSAKAGRPEMEVLACVWLTLGRVLVAHGANAPMLLQAFLSSVASVVGENVADEAAKPTVH